MSGLVRTLRSRSSVIVAETVLLAGLQLASFSVMARALPPSALGLWFLLNSLLVYTRIVDVWSNGLQSFVAQALGRDDRDGALTFVGTALITSALGQLLVALVGMGALWWLGPLLAGAEHRETIHRMLPVMALGFWLTSVGGTLQLGFIGFGRPELKVMLTVGGAGVFLLAVLVLAPRFGLMGILAAQVVQGAAMLAFGVIVFTRAVAKGTGFLRWRREQFRSVALYSSKAIVLGALQLATDPILKILVNHFGGLAAVPAVELASRLIASARSLIVSLGQIIVPAFAQLAERNPAGARQLLARMRELFLFASVPVFGLLVTAAPVAEMVLLGTSGSGFTTYVAILALGWAVNTLCGPSYFLLLSQRRLRPLIAAHVVMMLGVLLVGGVLGLVFGIVGVLWGVSLSIAAAAVSLDGEAARVFGFGDRWSLWDSFVEAIDQRLTLAIAAAATVPFSIAAGMVAGWPRQLALVVVATSIVLACAAGPRQLRNLFELSRRLG